MNHKLVIFSGSTTCIVQHSAPEEFGNSASLASLRTFVSSETRIFDTDFRIRY